MEDGRGVMGNNKDVKEDSKVLPSWAEKRISDFDKGHYRASGKMK